MITINPITDTRLGRGDHFGDWNAWPSLPIKSVDLVDPTNPYAVLDFGKRIGSATKMRQVFNRLIPTSVPLYGLRVAREGNGTTNVLFTLADARGQEDAEATRDVLALIDFRTHWRSSNPTTGDRGGYELVDPAVVVRLGCDHQYREIAKGNCYTRQRCTLCGHTWAVDSGD